MTFNTKCISTVVIICALSIASVHSKTSRSDGDDRWKQFISPNLTTFVKIRIFNVTNPREVTDLGEKPTLHELGPFTYQKTTEKTDIKFNTEDESIVYRLQERYYFRPDLSNGSLQGRIWTLNMPYLGVTTIALGYRDPELKFFQEFFDEKYSEVGALTELTIDEYLFKGKFFDYLQDLSRLTGHQVISNNSFGIYFNRNGSEQGTWKISSDLVKAPSDFGSILSYNGNASVNFWKEKFCNKINGSDGTLFPPNTVTKHQNLYVFYKDLCRSVHLTYEKEETVGGIKGYRFTLPTDIFGDPRNDNNSQCFCTQRKGDDFSNCPKRGLYQLHSCRAGFPFIVSLPHFLDADEEMHNFEGIHPMKQYHETYITVEPNTGMVLRSHKRFQMNMELIPSVKFKQLNNLSRLIVPMFWVDESSEAVEIKDTGIQTDYIPEESGGVLIAVGIAGAILLLVGIAVLGYLRRPQHDNGGNHQEIPMEDIGEQQTTCTNSDNLLPNPINV